MIKYMSTVEYKYVGISHDKLEKCLRWLQNSYQLRDWEIDLDTCFDIPKEFGDEHPDEVNALINIHPDRLRALVWIPLKRLKEQDENPCEALCHELTHVLMSRCGISQEDELAVRIISPVTYKAMCRELKIKLAGRK